MLISQSFDPLYGARPVLRFLEKKVGTEIGKLLLTNELRSHTTVEISKDDGKGTPQLLHISEPVAYPSDGLTYTLRAIRANPPVKRKRPDSMQEDHTVEEEVDNGDMDIDE